MKVSNVVNFIINDGKQELKIRVWFIATASFPRHPQTDHNHVQQVILALDISCDASPYSIAQQIMQNTGASRCLVMRNNEFGTLVEI